MKTIGLVVKEARSKKKLSREKLERVTKIKREFIEFIEREQWEKLPEYPVVSGFVKNIATTLGLPESHAMALLRRDYPPKVLKINPNPDLPEKFSWSPKLTFLAGVFAISLVLIGYLVYQYANFIKPPELIINEPSEDQVVETNSLIVRGSTDPNASVVVNSQPALVEENGNFSAEIEIIDETTEVIVVAKSRSGKETAVSRKIKPLLESE